MQLVEQSGLAETGRPLDLDERDGVVDSACDRRLDAVEFGAAPDEANGVASSRRVFALD